MPFSRNNTYSFNGTSCEALAWCDRSEVLKNPRVHYDCEAWRKKRTFFLHVLVSKRLKMDWQWAMLSIASKGLCVSLSCLHCQIYLLLINASLALLASNDLRVFFFAFLFVCTDKYMMVIYDWIKRMSTKVVGSTSHYY